MFIPDVGYLLTFKVLNSRMSLRTIIISVVLLFASYDLNLLGIGLISPNGLEIIDQPKNIFAYMHSP